MVFALVGDSTMTSDLGNVALFPVIQVEATTNQAEATNMTKALALRSWLFALGQACVLTLFLLRYCLAFSCLRLLQRPSAFFQIPTLQATTPASFEFWSVRELALYAH